MPQAKSEESLSDMLNVAVGRLASAGLEAAEGAMPLKRIARDTTHGRATVYRYLGPVASAVAMTAEHLFDLEHSQVRQALDLVMADYRESWVRTERPYSSDCLS